MLHTNAVASFTHFRLEHLQELCQTPYQDKGGSKLLGSETLLGGPSLTLTHYLVQYLQQEKQQADNTVEQLLVQQTIGRKTH